MEEFKSEIKEKGQVNKNKIIKEKIDRKTDPNEMPGYDINEPWVQKYIKDFGKEPSFF